VAEILAGAREYVALLMAKEVTNRRLSESRLRTVAAGAYSKFVRHGTNSKVPRLPRPQKPRRPTVKGETDIRSILYETAGKQIQEFGYPRITVKGLADEAGIAVGSFYAYFESRAGFFEQLLDYYQGLLNEYVAQRTREAVGFAETEAYSFQAYFEFASAYPWTPYLVFESAAWAPAVYSRHLSQVVESYLRRLRKAQHLGELKGFEGEEFVVLAAIFIAARHYLASRHLVAKNRGGLLDKWIREVYVELMCCGLQATD
jgi:AcrR family transcriptional regulator